MDTEKLLIISRDGTAKVHRTDFDITIMCESKKDQDDCMRLLKKLNESKKEPILDKIRAEIDSLERFEIRGEKTPLINGDNVLQILDKYMTESEDKT